MEAPDLLGNLERLLRVSKVGLFTSVDQEGYPHSRWMTPTVLKGRSGYLYAITATDSPKAKQVEVHGKVEWTFQSTVLNEIYTLNGVARLIMEPQLKAEVMESIGPNLQIFWRVNRDSKNFVVLETEIEQISLFYPMKNERQFWRSR